MNGFQEFLARFTGQADRLDKISNDLTTALSTVNAKDGEIADLKAKLEAAPKPEAIATLTAEIKTLTTRAETAEAEVKTLPEKINAEAARIIAGAGVPPVDAKGGNEQAGKTGILAQLEAIKDPMARSAFFRENKAAINKAYLNQK